MILNLLFTIQLDSDIKSNDYNSARQWGAELGPTTPLSHRPYWRWNLLWIRIHFGLWSWPCRFFSQLKPSLAPFWVCNLYLFRLGNCLQCSNCKSVFWTGPCCPHWVKEPIGLCGPNCQAHSTSSRRGAVLVVCYKLKKFYNKMSTFILCWTAPCNTPMTKLRQMFKYQIFIF